MISELERYSEYKTRIRLIDIEIDDSISLGSKSDDPMPGRVSVRQSESVVERQADRIAELCAEKRDLIKRVQKVDEIIKTLPSESQTLIRLRYEHGMSVNELTKRYCITDSSVRKRIYKILKVFSKYSHYKND